MIYNTFDNYFIVTRFNERIIKFVYLCEEHISSKSNFDAMQLCPQFMNLPFTAPVDALSISASSNNFIKSI